MKKDDMKIPINLARLLVAEREDLTEPTKYDEIQTIAKSLLRLLIKVAEEK